MLWMKDVFFFFSNTNCTGEDFVAASAKILFALIEIYFFSTNTVPAIRATTTTIIYMHSSSHTFLLLALSISFSSTWSL